MDNYKSLKCSPVYFPTGENIFENFGRWDPDGASKHQSIIFAPLFGGAGSTTTTQIAVPMTPLEYGGGAGSGEAGSGGAGSGGAGSGGAGSGRTGGLASNKTLIYLVGIGFLFLGFLIMLSLKQK